MLLVIDANVLFSALIQSQGITRRLFSLDALELISPEFVEEELEKYFAELAVKSKCSEIDLRIALNLLSARIKILSREEYAKYIEKARELSPDPKDEEYFAVALAFNCPIWSYDKRLKNQSSVKVLSTSEVLQLVKS